MISVSSKPARDTQAFQKQYKQYKMKQDPITKTKKKANNIGASRGSINMKATEHSC